MTRSSAAEPLSMGPAAGLYRRYRPRWRQDRPCRRKGRSRPARDQCRRPAGDPRLGRCPHPLRRPGNLGPGAGPILLAWRHHHPVRQLRRRFRPCPQRDHRRTHRPDGGGGGNPRHRAGRGAEMELGNLPRISRRAGADAADHRCRRADPAPPAARLCHGRPRHQTSRPATADDIADDARLPWRGCGPAHSASPPPAPTPQDADRRHGAGRYSEVDELLGIGRASARSGSWRLRHEQRLRRSRRPSCPG